jgi:hypothetical protein
MVSNILKGEENPSQTLLARVEKLIDEIRFVSDVARQQMRDKQFRDVVRALAYVACLDAEKPKVYWFLDFTI